MKWNNPINEKMIFTYWIKCYYYVKSLVRTHHRRFRSPGRVFKPWLNKYRVWEGSIRRMMWLGSVIWHYPSGIHSIGGWALFLVLNESVSSIWGGHETDGLVEYRSDHNRRWIANWILMLSALCRRPLDNVIMWGILWARFRFHLLLVGRERGCGFPSISTALSLINYHIVRIKHYTQHNDGCSLSLTHEIILLNFFNFWLFPCFYLTDVCHGYQWDEVFFHKFLLWKLMSLKLTIGENWICFIIFAFNFHLHLVFCTAVPSNICQWIFLSILGGQLHLKDHVIEPWFCVAYPRMKTALVACYKNF